MSQRLKNYSAASGYVYQYIFLGKQDRLHIFEVSADRSNAFPVSIDLSEEALSACAKRAGYELRWNDEYAFAKMSLFDAFDNRENPEAMKDLIRPNAEELLSHMKALRMVDDDD